MTTHACRADVLVWKLNGDKLVLDEAASSGLPAFIEGSKSMTFGSGEGLIGRAYSSGAVEFASNVQELSADQYLRGDLAKSCGIKGCAAVLKDGVVIECGSASVLSGPPAL